MSSTNQGPGYFSAEKKYLQAQTLEDKVRWLQEMIQNFKKHKGSEKMLAELKIRLKKLKKLIEKRQTSKKTARSLSIKKEGAAQVVLVGTTNTGKSTLLKKLTNAKIAISAYPFTTKKPVYGIMDYKGIKIQVVEIPSITKNFYETELGPTLLSIIRYADLMVLFFNKPEEKKLLDKELYDVNINKIIYDDSDDFKEKIWKALGLIMVYTKQPGKKPDYPPLALEKNDTVKDLATNVHKDFIKKFKYARIFGPSAKFKGQQVGLTHKLKDGDVIELHIK